MKLIHIIAGIILCGFCSCLVTAPRYTTVEKVFTLKIGMTKDSVDKILGTTPYLLKSLEDSEAVYLYKYRVTDRSTVPLFLGPTNGKSVRGKYVNLLVICNQDGKVTKLESCGKDCDETIIETNKFDINKIITFFTVTVPFALLFIGVMLGVKQN